jgi:hypothetical protein
MILSVLLLLTADLEVLSVKPADQMVRTDQTFSFVVRVRNHGPDAAEQVRVRAGGNASAVMYGITGPAEWTCDAPGPRFTAADACTTPTLAPGAEAELTVKLAAPQPTAVTYRVGAAVSSRSQDPQNQNNRLEVNMILKPSVTHAELTVSGRVVDAERAAFEVRNDGPENAPEVLVVVANAALASGPGWTCTPTSKGVACTRPGLEAGATATLEARGASSARLEARVRAEQIMEEVPHNNAARPE